MKEYYALKDFFAKGNVGRGWVLRLWRRGRFVKRPYEGYRFSYVYGTWKSPRHSGREGNHLLA